MTVASSSATDGPIRVLFAGGGTGGHLFPGIAVARELLGRYPSARVAFVGTGRPVETRVLPREGFQLERIRTSGLVGKSLIARLRGAAMIPLGALDALRLVTRYVPTIVIGLGGYSSGPLVLMAATRGVPTLVLEQNAVPGLTNRWLARVVGAAAVTYDETLPFFRGKGFVSGNPVRPGFFQLPPPRTSPDVVQILVVGGSQGAHALNVAMIESSAAFAAAPRPVRIVHQTGDNDRSTVQTAYEQAGLTTRVSAFLDDMEREMGDADIVVCRAGATTLAELAAAGRAAVLVPFPHAAHDHQRRNATVWTTAGAAEVLDPRELTAATLTGRVLSLVTDDARRAALAAASRQFARPKAAELIVDRMERLWGAGAPKTAPPSR